MTASWTYYGAEDNSTILYGTKGIMRIYDDPAAAIKVILTDGSKISYDVEAIQTNDNQTKSGVIDLWMDSLVNNREPEISRPQCPDCHACRVCRSAVFRAGNGRGNPRKQIRRKPL